MATIEITESTLEQTLASTDIVLIDFWAAWCAPCRSFAPTYNAASEKHQDITFAKVDTEAEQGLSAKAGITSIPTLMAFRDKVLVYAQPGALSGRALDSVIEGVRALDMPRIHAGLAAQQSTTTAP